MILIRHQEALSWPSGLWRPHDDEGRGGMQVIFPHKDRLWDQRSQGEQAFVGSRNSGQAQLEPLCMLELLLGVTLGGPVQGPDELASVSL